MRRSVQGALAAVALVVAVSACSSGSSSPASAVSSGSTGSSSDCTTWMVTEDQAVAVEETNAVCGDGGNIVMPNGNNLIYTQTVPVHSTQACSVPAPGGTSFLVYAGPTGDPAGESETVCGFLQNIEANS